MAAMPAEARPLKVPPLSLNLAGNLPASGSVKTAPQGRTTMSMARSSRIWGTASSPLLAVSAILALSGMSWAMVEICCNHPWVLLLGASFACLAVHCLIAIRSHGLLAFLPAWVDTALRQPVFELVRAGAALVVLAGGNVVRMLLLALGDLDEEQQRQVLEELSDDYRRMCFRQPSLELLPDRLQQIIVGTHEWEHRSVDSEDTVLEASMLQRGQVALSRQVSSSSAGSQQSRVGELLDQLRNAENAARHRRVEIPQIPLLKKVLNEKISDFAVDALRHGSRRQTSNAARTTVRAVKEQMTPRFQEVRHMTPRFFDGAGSAWSHATSLGWSGIVTLPWRLAAAWINLTYEWAYAPIVQVVGEMARRVLSDIEDLKADPVLFPQGSPKSKADDVQDTVDDGHSSSASEQFSFRQRHSIGEQMPS